ncbi:hypothetical protein ACFOSC_13215 [Streptantibioticus rubrisoli]|uniref:Uncharacterized protein n=1 Tax=Streptantibioticus rubrisoli TaxID=1387313 RepID=A0ABT1P7Q7_9ACTN|nr:hypothetical protein [Streptantibioticus rubrisoli]MCQ4041412.1 hypothetical protein [Streptantibioticus rubrisoli]
MSANTDKPNWQPSGRDQSHGLNIDEIESYLCQQAYIGKAQHFAERFADRMPWLTTSQRQVVIRHYSADWLNHMDHLASRYEERRQQDSLRHRSQKARLVALLLGAVAVTAGTVAELTSLLAARR